MSRILPFKTVYNFRDFGGYTTKEKGRVLNGKLFRSANLNQLGGDDIETFKALGISAIIDMRYRPEREKQPNKLPPDFTGISLAYGSEDGHVAVKVAPHEAFLEHDLHTGEDSRQYMLASYARRPHDIGFQKLTQQSLQHMAETGDNILIHCAAGKDRTGLLVAIIQHVLGVSREDIIEDYMLTLEAVNIDMIIEAVLPKISDRHGRTYTADMLRPMFGVSEDYLISALDEIGDMNVYLEKVIGLDAVQLNALKAYYTAK